MENEPRLKGRGLINDQNNTIVKKEHLLFVKKEKCPPWEMSAEEIRHDKKKRL